MTATRSHRQLIDAEADLQRLDTLETVRRALRREVNGLAERPELTWQQLHNRLQWADPPLADDLTAERERRSRPGARPWIHRYSRLRESDALVRTLTGHTGSVFGCAVSPDGTWIVSASRDGTLKIWDAATGRSRATLTGHSGQVRACAVSPDGTWIVSAGDDEALKIWDAVTGRNRTTLTGHTGSVNGCAVSPDGTWIVSAGRWDHTLKIWDAVTGTNRTTLAGHTGSVLGCAVSPDGTWIVSASGDGTLKSWDAATGAERVTFTGHSDEVNACAVSSDGTRIVSAGDDEALKVWDAATIAERATFTGHSGKVNACAVSPDGTWIVSASDDETLKIWDAATGAERATLTGHSGKVRACAVSPDGTWIVSANGTHSPYTLKIWDAATGAERATLKGRTWSLYGLAVSPDGAWIISGTDVWDAATGRKRARATLWYDPIRIGSEVSPDGTFIVSASSGTLKIRDAATGTERATLTGHSSWVNACAVSPDCAWIVSASHDQTLRIWDVATGTERAMLALPGAATAVAFHPSAPIVACGDAGGNAHFAHLVGIDFGPLVVTAAVHNHKLTVRCAACREAFPIELDRLDTETNCPRPACGGRLRISPFVLRPLPLRPREVGFVALVGGLAAAAFAQDVAASWWLAAFVFAMVFFVVGRVAPDVATAPARLRRAAYGGMMPVVSTGILALTYSLWGQWWLAVVLGWILGVPLGLTLAAVFSRRV